MYEVEVKVRADHDAVRTRLDELGVTRERRVEQVDTYYDAPDRDFAATDEALRIRRETRHDTDDATSTTRLTYKGPLVDEDSKTREEHETPVPEGETMAAILDGLGYTPAATVEKVRDYYTLDGDTVVLDTVTDLGTFVEVERESEDIDTAREAVFARLRQLGLDPDDQIRTSYLALLHDSSQ